MTDHPAFRIACFLGGVALLGLGGYAALWAISSSSLAITACKDGYSLFAETFRCKQPHLASLAMCVSLALCYGILLRFAAARVAGRAWAPGRRWRLTFRTSGHINRVAIDVTACLRRRASWGSHTLLSLDDPRWFELQHAYGTAADIPALLKQLADLPSSENNSEPWFSIWSALAHQGDVYSASFAAVPHVIAALASAPLKADFSYFQFPAWIEICRTKKGVSVPEDIAPAYFESLSRLPSLVGSAAARSWDEGFLCCALSAVAAAKGQPSVAEAVLELSPEVASEFIEWFYVR